MRKCCEKQWDVASKRWYPCRYNAKVTRNAKGYCGIHDPERIEAKRSERHNEQDQQWNATPALDAARDAVIGEARKLIESIESMWDDQTADGVIQIDETLSLRDALAGLTKLEDARHLAGLDRAGGRGTV